jgi:hypothetical protein
MRIGLAHVRSELIPGSALRNKYEIRPLPNS